MSFVAVALDVVCGRICVGVRVGVEAQVERPDRAWQNEVVAAGRTRRRADALVFGHYVLASRDRR